MKFTFYGHACFMIEIEDSMIESEVYKLLFDPFISPNELAKDIDINSINPSHILLSHGHGDHVADAVPIAARTNAMVISNYEIYTWLTEKHGIKNAHPMNHGGKWPFSFGKAKMVNAIHSSVLPDGSNGGNPAGFVITTADSCFYYAGDTALTYDMKLIGEQHKLDFAILPIGDNFTMGIDDAIICADFIKCDTIIGVHYDTFGFIKIDHEAAKKSFADAGKTLHLLDIGASIDL